MKILKSEISISFPSQYEIEETFKQAELELLHLAKSQEDPSAETLYVLLEQFRDWLLEVSSH